MGDMEVLFSNQHEEEQKRAGQKKRPTEHKRENVLERERPTNHAADTYASGAISGIAQRAAHHWEEDRIPHGEGVIQAAGHVEGGDVDPKAGQGITLPVSQYPTMVYESMGTDLRQCLSVYEQSKRYPGNSICIFGLNARKPEGETTGKILEKYTQYEQHQGLLPRYQANIEHGIDERFLEAEDAVIRGIDTRALDAWAAGRAGPEEGKPYHLLYPCHFTWKKPIEADKGYDMPYVEARLLLMGNASTIVNNISKGKDGKIPSNQFLYRWIDGDATEDTTPQIPVRELQKMAGSGDRQIITGRYDWRHEEPGTGRKEKYHQFIELLNGAERELREYYYELVERSPENVHDTVLRLQPPGIPRVNGHASQMLREQVQFPINYATGLKKPHAGNYIPGYYLPETTMLMNETAHESAYEKGVGESSQDQESMKILDSIFGEIVDGGSLPTGSVIYRSELSVKKPLKHEFVQDSYLGRNMRDFLTTEEGDEKGFINALKNIRQSAWGDQWYFISNANWKKWEEPRTPKKGSDMENRQELFNRKRRLLKDRLWFGSLKDHKKAICTEIGSGT